MEEQLVELGKTVEQISGGGSPVDVAMTWVPWLIIAALVGYMVYDYWRRKQREGADKA